jgi:hypothetical protein
MRSLETAARWEISAGVPKPSHRYSSVVKRASVALPSTVSKTADQLKLQVQLARVVSMVAKDLPEAIMSGGMIGVTPEGRGR